MRQQRGALPQSHVRTQRAVGRVRRQVQQQVQAPCAGIVRILQQLQEYPRAFGVVLGGGGQG